MYVDKLWTCVCAEATFPGSTPQLVLHQFSSNSGAWDEVVCSVSTIEYPTRQFLCHSSFKQKEVLTL